MGHSNLSPGLNQLIADGDNPNKSFNLREVRLGQKLTIVFKGADGPERMIELEITRSAGPDVFKQSAAGRVLKTNHPELPKEGATLELIASCTNNPGAPMGFSMYHAGTLTVGRNAVLAEEGEKNAFWLRHEVILRMKLE